MLSIFSPACWPLYILGEMSIQVLCSFFKSYFIIQFIYLFLAVLGLCCSADFSLAVASGGCCVVLVLWILIAVGSLAAEPRP